MFDLSGWGWRGPGPPIGRFRLNDGSPLARGLTDHLHFVSGGAYLFRRQVLIDRSNNPVVAPTVTFGHGHQSDNGGGSFSSDLFTVNRNVGSVAFWVRCDVQIVNFVQLRLFDFFNGPGDAIAIFYNAFSSKRLTFAYYKGFSAKAMAETTAITAGETGYYVFTWFHDGANINMTLYKNGKLDGTSSQTISLWSTENIGLSNTVDVDSDVANGQSALGPISIWDRVLTAAEAAALYNPATRWDLYQSVFPLPVAKPPTFAPPLVPRIHPKLNPLLRL